MTTNKFEGHMVTKMAIAACVIGLVLVSPVLPAYTKPHIIMVVADDLGWDDVSFHGSNQIPTPTLDRLAKEGVVLNNYYVSPLSTPSRAAFMTGKYASHLGLQHDDFHNQQPSGLPLSESLLPSRLRDLGYSAHGVGKWHLGFFAKEYTPTFRGFDSYFGFWTDTEDYYSHVSYDNGYGLDLRRNLQLVYNESGKYSTELFTREAKTIIKEYENKKPLFLYLAHQAVHVGNGDDPLQVPEKYVKQFAGIKDLSRRKFAGMVATLDESLKEITEALTAKGMIQNTIIIFTTDNGGASGGFDNSAGSNYPLRGSKNTFWEGGVRGVGFVYSPLLKKKGRICEELVHATDWLPTLYAAGGGSVQSLGKIDGYNIWETISNSEPSPRFEVLHGVDSFSELSGALRVGDYKLIVNQDDNYYGDWYPRPGVPIPKGTSKRKRRQLIEGTTVDCTIREPHPLLFTHAPVCKPRERPCLFNIKWDPCEYHNIAEIMPNTMKVMLERFYYFANSSKAPIYPDSDNSSRPDLHDGSWTFWRDDPHIPPSNTKFVYPNPMADLKMNDHGGSSAPYTPPDNEKIFKEKAKKFANLTKHHKNSQLKHHHANHTAVPPPIHKAPPPPVLKHQSYNISSPNVQKVEPSVIIEGIGNLIEPQINPLAPTTAAPFVPATTENSFLHVKPTEPPVIDIQNVLMDDGSGNGPIISPTPEYMAPTKAPAKPFKPVTLGEVISGRNGKKTSTADKNLGTKLHSDEIKIDLPQVYDVIDETDNPPASQAPTEIPVIHNIYDVIDINKEQTKATSKQQDVAPETSKKPVKPAKKIPPKPVPSPKITPPVHAPPASPLSTFFKPKPHPAGVAHEPHKFTGDIVMDGHRFHVEGTETGDTDWLMKDFAPDVKNSPLSPYQSTPSPKSRVSKPKGKPDNKNVASADYSEVTDIIVESPKANTPSKLKKGSELNLEKPESVGKLLKDAAEFDSPTKNIQVTPHHVQNSGNITKQNDTNCEKPVQLESSDNAVVVSSVVIVVIASAMVVGVALVAMIAVVARHFQRAKNLNAGGAS